MRVIREPDVGAFADRVLPFLLGDPVRNSLPCQLVIGRRDGLVPTEPDALWLWVRDTDGALCGVALQTPPHPLVLTDMPPVAAEALAERLAADRPALPGVHGPNGLAARFARTFTTRTGRTAEPGMGLRLFRLEAVRPPAQVPGRLREAVAADRDLLVEWSAEFFAEALPDEEADPSRLVDLRLGRPGLAWVWEDGATPVSVAYRSEPALGVTRVSGVYTPPALRGRGYASACVAGLSQAARASGVAYCVLFTDLANPTSNKIYQAIGYEPVGDAQVWNFS